MVDLQRAREALSANAESLVSRQTPAAEQPIGEDDQCDDVETSPNDTGIAQVEEETDESISNVEANNGGAGSA